MQKLWRNQLVMLISMFILLFLPSISFCLVILKAIPNIIDVRVQNNYVYDNPEIIIRILNKGTFKLVIDKERTINSILNGISYNVSEIFIPDEIPAGYIGKIIIRLNKTDCYDLNKDVSYSFSVYFYITPKLTKFGFIGPNSFTIKNPLSIKIIGNTKLETVYPSIICITISSSIPETISYKINISVLSEDAAIYLLYRGKTSLISNIFYEIFNLSEFSSNTYCLVCMPYRPVVIPVRVSILDITEGFCPLTSRNFTINLTPTSYFVEIYAPSVGINERIYLLIFLVALIVVKGMMKILSTEK